jgi:hypothetical protein
MFRVHDYALDTSRTFLRELWCLEAVAMNLLDVYKELDTETKCLAFLEHMRWPGGVKLTKPALLNFAARMSAAWATET